MLDKPRSYFFIWPEKQLTSIELTQFEAALQQRLEGKPVAPITGQRFFWSLDLRVNNATLIPRLIPNCCGLALSTGQLLTAELESNTALQVVDGYR